MRSVQTRLHLALQVVDYVFSAFRSPAQANGCMSRRARALGSQATTSGQRFQAGLSARTCPFHPGLGNPLRNERAGGNRGGDVVVMATSCGRIWGEGPACGRSLRRQHYLRASVPTLLLTRVSSVWNRQQPDPYPGRGGIFAHVRRIPCPEAYRREAVFIGGWRTMRSLSVYLPAIAGLIKREDTQPQRLLRGVLSMVPSVLSRSNSQLRRGRQWMF
jgi:hypothetical protein